MTTIILSIPAHASTYTDLSGDDLRAAVAAWGSYLEEQLTVAGYEVEVKVTREARIHGLSVQDDGAEADAIEITAARISDKWLGLSDEERAEYGCPALNESPAGATPCGATSRPDTWAGGIGAYPMPDKKSRSGPSLQRHERTRKILQLTISDDARAVLRKASADMGTTQSALVEMLVLYHLQSKAP